jgi:CubicO group peptidase (beta-lactamase class C family)
MKAFLAVCTTAFLVLNGQAAEHAGKQLPRSSPEEQGISSKAILAFVNAADRKIDAMNSFMLVRHGHVVAEGWWRPYSAQSPHELYSLSKSFTSTAVGLAIAEGKLSINDPVLKFFPDDAPAQPSANLRAMRVHDLLRMSTGHQTEPAVSASKEPWTKTFLAHPVPFKPGTHFLYNTAGTYMLSAIVQKATGQTVLDYLRPRLFEPLGIENPTWGTSPQGVSLGGYGLNIRTEDIARFGQLYLQKGQWHGRQLVPAAWIEAATKLETSNGSNPNSDWDQGYGYQFWRCRHGGYRGDGAFGQYCIVLPKQDAVVAITSGTGDMPGVLNLVWDKLLPAMRDSTLPTDEEHDRELASRLASLTLPTPRPVASARVPEDISSQMYHFPANAHRLEALGIETRGAGNPVTLTLKFKDGATQRITCGEGKWNKGRLAIGRFKEQPVAAAGAWTGDGVYTAKICLYETPFYLTMRLECSRDKLRLDWSPNVGFGPRNKMHLVGELRQSAGRQ